MATPATLAYIGLGSNLGDRLHTLQNAVQALGDIPQTQVLRCSSLYSSSAAEGAAGSGDFFNAVAEISTTLDPHALLTHLQAIELQAGRQRPYHHAPRTLDLDILLFGSANIADAPTLIVPHPRLWQRDFAYLPLLELQAHLASIQQKQNPQPLTCQILFQNWTKRLYS
jgi:2-amino-4-hydroxy-6-hydroxymethyldihydropteridine diphosphokinase